MTPERDQLRLRANAAFNAALRRGEVAKPAACSECGTVPDEPFLLRAHHVDHALPLEVEWLCARCHSGRNFEAYLSGLVTIQEWSAIVAKAKREGISLRALILGWLKDWIHAPQSGA